MSHTYESGKFRKDTVAPLVETKLSIADKLAALGRAGLATDELPVVFGDNNYDSEAYDGVCDDDGAVRGMD